MPAPIGPQRKKVSVDGTVSVGTAYVTILDITAAGFRAQGIAVANLDNNRRLILSYDGGVTDDLTLDPRINPGVMLDNFHPPSGTVQAKSSAGTVEVTAMAWA